MALGNTVITKSPHPPSTKRNKDRQECLCSELPGAIHPHTHTHTHARARAYTPPSFSLGPSSGTLLPTTHVTVCILCFLWMTGLADQSRGKSEEGRDGAGATKKQGAKMRRRWMQHHFEHGAARSLASLGTEIGIGIPEDSSLDRYRFFLFLHHASVSLSAQIEFLRSRPIARGFLDSLLLC